MIDIDRVNWGFSFLFAQEKAIIKEERHYRMSTCFSLTKDFLYIFRTSLL